MAPQMNMPMMEMALAGIPDLDNFNMDLPVGPALHSASQPGAATGGGGGPVELNITIEKIEVIAQGGDPQQIAAQIGDQLRAQVRQLVEEVDTLVRA